MTDTSKQLTETKGGNPAENKIGSLSSIGMLLAAELTTISPDCKPFSDEFKMWGPLTRASDESRKAWIKLNAELNA